MSLDRYFRIADFVKSCLDAFGDAIASIHAKDTLLQPYPFTFSLCEVPIGQGNLDYRRILPLLDALPRNTPLLIEHLHSVEEYAAAGDYIRKLAAESGVSLD